MDVNVNVEVDVGVVVDGRRRLTIPERPSRATYDDVYAHVHVHDHLHDHDGHPAASIWRITENAVFGRERLHAPQ